MALTQEQMIQHVAVASLLRYEVNPNNGALRSGSHDYCSISFDILESAFLLLLSAKELDGIMIWEAGSYLRALVVSNQLLIGSAIDRGEKLSYSESKAKRTAEGIDRCLARLEEVIKAFDINIETFKVELDPEETLESLQEVLVMLQDAKNKAAELTAIA